MENKTQVTDEDEDVTDVEGSAPNLLAFHDDLIQFICMIEYQLDSNFETLESHDAIMSMTNRKANGLLFINRMIVAYGYELSDRLDHIRKDLSNNTKPDPTDTDPQEQ